MHPSREPALSLLESARLWLISGVSTVLLACGSPTDSREEPTDWSRAGDWTTHQGGPHHTGHVPVVLDASRFEEAWVYDFAGVGAFTVFGLNQTAAADGLIAVSSRYEARVGVFDARTGAPLWIRDFVDGPVDPPALFDGSLYVRQGDSIWSMDATTGSVRWGRFHNADGIQYRAPVLLNARLVMGGLQHSVPSQRWLGASGRDVFTGVEFWRSEFLEDGNWSATVVDGTAFVLGSPQGAAYVRAFDVATGDSLFSILDPGYDGTYAASTLALAGSHHLVAGQGGRLVAYDLNTRSVAWEIALGYYAGYRREPTVTDSVVYAARLDSVSAHRLSDGEILWTAPAETALVPLVSTTNMVFISSEDETVAVDVHRRRVVWRYPLSGYLTIAKEGLLVIAGRTGRLAVIDLG